MSINSSVLISAEIGSVHDGSLGNALSLIEMSAAIGADTVKFQTHIAEAETLEDAPTPTAFKGEPRYEYFQRTGFSKDLWKLLKEKCDSENIEFMSSPFSIEAVELLEELNMNRYKIPSGEVTNLPMLEVIAETKKQILLSTGMSNINEIDKALNTINKHNDDVIILQCTSAYPCPYERVGLNLLPYFSQRYDLPVGFSDHTPSNYASFAAVVLGACYIEKHLTFSRYMYGSDAKYGIEPDELSDLVKGIRAIESILAWEVNKDELADSMHEIKSVFQKSIVSITNIAKGTVIRKNMIGFKKPGSGIMPKDLDRVLNKSAKKDIFKNSLIREEDLI